MELGRSQAEVALTRKLAATLVQKEMIEPMEAIGWGHGTPPTAEILAAHAARVAAQNPGGNGQPGIPTEAPAVAPAPVAPTQSGQPAPAPKAPAPVAVAQTDASAPAEQNVVALFESLRDPATGLIMGKYKDVPAALKGAGHLASMAKDALARAERAEAALTAAPAPLATSPAAAPAAAPAPRPIIPASRAELDAAQARVDKVLSSLGEDAVLTGESAREYATAVRELAAVQSRVSVEDERRQVQHAQDAETEKWNAVNEYMRTKYPDSVNFNDEVGLHVRLNPLLAETVKVLVAQGRETLAAELAWQEFDKARGGSGTPNLSRADAERTELDLAAREQVRKEARDQALKDAGIIHGSAGGNSSLEAPGITGPSQDDINKYADGMRREGDAPGSSSAARWRHAVIGRFLPPELFGPTG